MPIIDIIIPSLRPKNIVRRIKEFSYVCKHIDYRLIIISPFVVRGPNVLHIQENSPRGTVVATNEGFEASDSPFVVFWSDDASPAPRSIENMLRFIEKKTEPALASFRYLDLYGHELPQYQVYGRHYACWGCASRNTIKAVGGLLDPIYRSFWADPDLSCRVWEKGGRVDLCPDAYIFVFGKKDSVSINNGNKHHEIDTKAFLKRWHQTLGGNLPINHWREINNAIEADKLLATQIHDNTQTWHPKISNNEIITFVESSELSLINLKYILELEKIGLKVYLLCTNNKGHVETSLTKALIGQEFVSLEQLSSRKENLAQDLGANWYISLKYGEIPHSPLKTYTLKDFIKFVDALGYSIINVKSYNQENLNLIWKQPASNLFINKDGDVIHPSPEKFFLPIILGSKQDFDDLQPKILEQTLTEILIMLSCHQYSLASNNLDTYAILHFVNSLAGKDSKINENQLADLAMAIQNGSKENTDKYLPKHRDAATLVLKTFAKLSENNDLMAAIDKATTK